MYTNTLFNDKKVARVTYASDGGPKNTYTSISPQHFESKSFL